MLGREPLFERRIHRVVIFPAGSPKHCAEPVGIAVRGEIRLDQKNRPAGSTGAKALFALRRVKQLNLLDASQNARLKALRVQKALQQFPVRFISACQLIDVGEELCRFSFGETFVCRGRSTGAVLIIGGCGIGRCKLGRV